ncbi:hypothetical protein SARC_05156 [Sphaeroforma arctica JP610]|uniref:YrhK domain-containing protein n=1 Tax=Sphaeroforma arctica JP610 TaxID=667725 RepID=A0A0L0G0I8_9EUKA|nr:hypothetical protein SARC_05156 [Sphaeroforma arctica JP610]KNC82560.1 hypothetical protein SARC_05156 [Sphaeroforma arctica JP610]|eukprot:XP_014156462.1 hypothetical protein SARC_05156 [Sphaeroforma arctica JP610]
MPHLITNRRREYKGIKIYGHSVPLEGLNALMYLIGGVGFLIGSVLFLPIYDDYKGSGAWLFVGSSFCFVMVALHDILEARSILDKAWRVLWVRHVYDKEEKSKTVIGIWKWLEVVVAVVYSIAAITFVVGSFFFVPEYENTAVGSWLFVWGSVLYGFGACINMLQVYLKSSAVLIQLLMFTSAQFLIGSVLFLVGSVVFLLDIQDPRPVYIIDTFAGWLFIVGSILFVGGALTNALRAKYSHRHENKMGPKKQEIGDAGNKKTIPSGGVMGSVAHIA